MQTHPAVEWVNYPGLPTSKYYARAQKYLPDGSGALVTFGIKGGYEAGRKLINSLSLFSLLANLGDSKSLVIHPASTTHAQLSEAEQRDTGVTPELVRLSVGTEDVRDLIDDLNQALKTATGLSHSQDADLVAGGGRAQNEHRHFAFDPGRALALPKRRALPWSAAGCCAR